MPTNYQFQPLPLANENTFDEFVMELFNELNPNSEYETYGRRGQNQDGIDIICFEDKVVIQCKKKEFGHTTNSINKLKSQIKKEFREDLESAVKSTEFEFDKFIFATTFPTDTDLQNLARKLSIEFNKDVKYMGWGVITQKLHDCPNTLQKYYDSLILESTRVSDSKFKDSVKSKHIIDQCYESLIRFEGFEFIDPRTISGIYPFKKSSERTYPLYNNFCLETNNEKLVEFFDDVILKNDRFEIKSGKKKEIKKQCQDVDEKLSFIQKVLVKSLIRCVKTPDGMHHKIPYIDYSNQNTSPYLAEELKFSELIESLIKNPNTLSSVYGYYQLHDFKKATKELNNYLKSEFNPIRLSIARYNEYWLSILSSNKRVSKFEFYSKIRSIEFDNEPVQEAIIDLEQDRVLTRAHQKIDNIVDEIKAIYVGYEKGGYSTSGPNYAMQLKTEAMIVYANFRYNYLIKDVYPEYQSLFRKTVQGWLYSLNTSNSYTNRLKEFQIFHVAMCIFSSSGKELNTILKEIGVKSIQMDKQACDYLSKCAINFLDSISSETYRNYVNDSFGLGSSHRSIFQSLLVIIAYSSMETFNENLFKTLLNFVKNENYLFLYDYNFIGLLFKKKGRWFSANEHIEILEAHFRSRISISQSLIEGVLISYKKNHSEERIDNIDLLEKILSLTTNELSNSLIVRNIRLISTDSALIHIDMILEQKLKTNFNSDLYRQLLLNEIPFAIRDDWFEKYVDNVNKEKGQSIYVNHDGFEAISNYEFLNFISAILHCPTRTLGDPIILNCLKDLSTYQKWLLKPTCFDYTNFNIEWMGFSEIEIVLKHLGQSQELKEILINELKINASKKMRDYLLIMLVDDVIDLEN